MQEVLNMLPPGQHVYSQIKLYTSSYQVVHVTQSSTCTSVLWYKMIHVGPAAAMQRLGFGVSVWWLPKAMQLPDTYVCNATLDCS